VIAAADKGLKTALIADCLAEITVNSQAESFASIRFTTFFYAADVAFNAVHSLGANRRRDLSF
jgi:hypothetical protein